jgi:hypothetical protein
MGNQVDACSDSARRRRGHPAETALNIALVREQLQVLDGARVFDSYRPLLGMTELLVRM